MIFIAGISIALFISSLILVKKDKSKSDIFLFLWMILNALHLTFFYLLYSETIYDYPFLLGLQLPLPLLQGVLLYFYVSAVTNQFPSKKFVPLLHLIPSIITFTYLIPFFLLPSEQKIEIFKGGGENYGLFQVILLVSVFISGIVYVLWSSLLLRKHKKRIRNQFSDIEEINLSWLQFLTYGLGVVWAFVIITQSDAIIFGSVSVFVILIGFFGIQQKIIFIAEKENKIDIKEKYTSSSLSDENADKYYKDLGVLMSKDKVYKKSELSLTELASILNIHSNYLSEIINKKEGKPFYDYINTYRVEEFKNLIAIPGNKQFTLMAIAYDCGFNSKSSFNRYFKKVTGLTPSQYVKTLAR